MAITAAEIKDRASFVAWLESRPGLDQHKTSLVLASRTALRVFPTLGSIVPNSASAQIVLETLRAIMISRVALKFPTDEILEAARSKVEAADSSAKSINPPVSNAARFAAYCAAASAGNFAISSAGDGATFAHETAIDGIWEAISDDAVSLENARFSPLALPSRPLWQNGPPEWWAYSIKKFGDFLLELNKYSPLGLLNPRDWPIWFEWLNSVANGNQSFDLPTDIADTLEMRIAVGDGRKDFWEFESPVVVSGPISNSGFLGQKGVRATDTAGGFDGTVSEALIRTPELINVEIAGWVAEARVQAQSLEKPEEFKLSDFASKPASIQTDVINGKVELSISSPIVDLKSPILQSAITDLCEALVELKTIAEAKNADRALIELLPQISETLAKAPTDQVSLFKAGRQQKALLAYGATVANEWDSVSAAQYHATVLQIDDLLLKFPAWQEFIFKPPRPISPPPLQEFIESATEALLEIQQGVNKNFIGSAVAAQFEQLIGQLERYKNTVSEWAKINSDSESDAILLAGDIAQSFGNFLRTCAKLVFAFTKEPVAKGARAGIEEGIKLIVKLGVVGGPAIGMSYMLHSYWPSIAASVLRLLQAVLKLFK